MTLTTQELQAEVRAHYTAQGKPDVGEKVARAWAIVHESVRPRVGEVDADPAKVIDGMPEVIGDKVFVVLVGDLDEDTYRVIERTEVVL